MPISECSVTIGIASFNNARYIVTLLDSIRNQTYSNIQLVVLDDCSTDNSVTLIEKWASDNDFPTKLICHTSNKGLVAVITELRRHATGEFVLWLGSDDWLLPNMITDSVEEFSRRGPECGAVYSDCLIVDKMGVEIESSFLHHFNRSFGPQYPEGNLRISLLSGFYVPTVTCLVRRKALEQIGPYDLSLGSEDLDTWLRLSVDWNFAYLPKVTAAYRVHDQSISNSSKPILNETYFLIYQKNEFQQGDEINAANNMLAEHAEHYYNSRNRNALSFLWKAYRSTGRLKLLGFYIAAYCGISHQQLLNFVSKTKFNSNKINRR